MSSLPRNTILVGDVRQRLAALPDSSVDCVITSPPYFQLRDYQVQGQIGLEDTVTEWVDELRTAFRGLARVLKPTGSAWLNLGDSYSRHSRFGAPPKSLLLGPQRVALGLVEDGWTVRNIVTWEKSNTMPSSVQDRLSTKSEVIYFLTRSRQYHFDLDAIRVPHRSSRTSNRTPDSRTPISTVRPVWAGPLAGSNSGLARMKAEGRVGNPLGKNPGDVWTLAASNYRGQHFATFPPGLVERPLLATCPERVCGRCGLPWTRQPIASKESMQRGPLRPACACRAYSQPGLVLDPFMGAGTVGVVAEQLGRDWLGIELNPDFAALATDRIETARNQMDKERRRGHAA